MTDNDVMAAAALARIVEEAQRNLARAYHGAMEPDEAFDDAVMDVVNTVERMPEAIAWIEDRYATLEQWAGEALSS